MDNTDLILLLGFGLTATSLALVLPASPSRPVWLPMLLGVVGAVLGLLAALTVLFR